MPTTISLDKDEQDILALIKSNKIPSYRQAYSDRTAWLMAMLSELAYQPFGSIDPKIKDQMLQQKLDTLLNKKTKEALSELVYSIHKNDAGATKQLISELEKCKISIKRTYDHDDTQAFLVSIGDHLALIFRGTEATSFKDIKSDANAIMKPCTTNGGIHSGFSEAFEKVAANIQSDLELKEYASKPLFIAGHSLGGALAIIAAKKLSHKGGIAACYTFGSPKVGNEEWSYGLKTPVYRVVNAVDCVPMLPPDGEEIGVLKFVAGRVPLIGSTFRKFLSKVEGYHHVGDMRYLTNCKPDQYDDVELTYAVSFLRRMQIVLKAKSVAGFVKDHSISIYRRKLAIIALRRN